MVGMAFMAWALGADLRSVVAGDSLIEKINGTREGDYRHPLTSQERYQPLRRKYVFC